MTPSAPASSSASSGRLAPGILIAVPGLHDPNFSHSVVFLIESGPEGSYGVVVNRQAPVTLAALLEFAGIHHALADGRSVWLGGPVQPQAGLVLYEVGPTTPEYDPQADVVPGLRVSSSMDILRDIARGKGPSRYALYLGRASWAAGQLESEVREGTWLPAEPDLALLFRADAGEIWRDAVRSLGADPGIVASTAAEA